MGVFGDIRFKGIPNIESISVSFSRQKNTGKTLLESLPKLRELSISGEGLPEISGQLPSLIRLNVTGKTNPTRFRRLSKELPILEELTLITYQPVVKMIAENELQWIKKLNRLKKLSLEGVQMKDGLKLVEEMQHLESVWFFNMTNASGDHKVRITHPNLRSLRISNLNRPIGSGAKPYELEILACPNLKNMTWGPYSRQINFVDTPKLKSGSFQYDQGPLEINLSRSRITDWKKLDFGIFLNDTVIVPPDNLGVKRKSD
jgi:hypothetical protein